MTTFNSSPALTMATDAGFRAIIIEYSTRMAAVGLVQTADTGQINTATVTRAANNTDAGYQIWRFADTLQATAPIYFKLFYGTAGSTTRFPRIRIQLGTGSDGAGTLTDPSATVIVSTATVTAFANTLPHYYCAADGFFGAALAHGFATAGMAGSFFSISRTVDADGDPDGRGVLMVGSGPGSGGSNAYSCATITGKFDSPPVWASSQGGSTAATWATIGLCNDGNLTSASNGATASDIFMYPALQHIGGRYEQFGSIAWSYKGEVGGAGATCAHTLIGTRSRTYINVQHAAQAIVTGGGATPAATDIDLLMVWE